VDAIHLTKDTEKWQVFVNMAVNLGVPWNEGKNWNRATNMAKKERQASV